VISEGLKFFCYPDRKICDFGLDVYLEFPEENPDSLFASEVKYHNAAIPLSASSRNYIISGAQSASPHRLPFILRCQVCAN
jgi:hypothetical protein